MAVNIFVAGPFIRDELSDPIKEWTYAIYHQFRDPYDYYFRGEMHFELPGSKLSRPPRGTLEGVLAGVRRADAVVVVFPYQSTAIGIEAGFAIALGKRL